MVNGPSYGIPVPSWGFHFTWFHRKSDQEAAKLLSWSESPARGSQNISLSSMIKSLPTWRISLEDYSMERMNIFLKMNGSALKRFPLQQVCVAGGCTRDSHPDSTLWLSRYDHHIYLPLLVSDASFSTSSQHGQDVWHCRISIRVNFRSNWGLFNTHICQMASNQSCEFYTPLPQGIFSESRQGISPIILEGVS